jgi:hypothetical protein
MGHCNSHSRSSLVKNISKNKAWLRREIAAAASLEAASEKPFLPITNQEFTQCSQALRRLAESSSMRHGQRLALPSHCLPPLL